MKQRQKIRKGIIVTAFFLFPAVCNYFSPMHAIEASETGIVNGSLIIFLAMFVGSLFLGRGYCGWACPGGGCQESIFPARSKEVTRGNFMKWLIWVPWIGMVIVSAIKAGGYNKIDFFFQTTHGLSIGDFKNLLTYYVILIPLIVLPAFVLGKRSFCHHICWMAPFMILGRKIRNRLHWAALQLKSDPGRCRHCGICSTNCPMSLPVEKMVEQETMENSECILCGACVDACRHAAITYEWGK